jgi:hypothetical protein
MLMVATTTTTLVSSKNSEMLSVIDQQQQDTSEYYWLEGGEANWQQFKNIGNMLEEVELHIACANENSYPITLSIEETIGGTPLTQVIYKPGDLPLKDPAWFTFDVPDVQLQANKIYYMVLRFDPGSEYAWSGAHRDPYPLGISSHPDADWDFAFKTIVDKSKTRGFDTPVVYFLVNHPNLFLILRHLLGL